MNTTTATPTRVKHDPEKLALNHMLHGGVLTSLDALFTCHTMRLPEYIRRLEAKGWTIRKEWTKINGARVKKWWIDPADPQPTLK